MWWRHFPGGEWGRWQRVEGEDYADWQGVAEAEGVGATDVGGPAVAADTSLQSLDNSTARLEEFHLVRRKLRPQSTESLPIFPTWTFVEEKSILIQGCSSSLFDTEMAS